MQTRTRIYWAAGLIAALVVAVALLEVREAQQRKAAAEKAKEIEKLEWQMRKFSEDEKRFAYERDVAGRLEDYRSVIEQMALRLDNRMRIDEHLGFQSFDLSQILGKYFSGDDLPYVLDKKHLYTKRYIELLKAANARPCRNCRNELLT